MHSREPKRRMGNDRQETKLNSAPRPTAKLNVLHTVEGKPVRIYQKRVGLPSEWGASKL